MEALETLPPIVLLIVGFLLLVWIVLVLLVPFMIEGIRQSTRKTFEELAEMNGKLDRLNALLSQGTPPPGNAYRGDAPATEPPPRGRREPTISESTVYENAPRERREPIVR